MSTRQQRLNSPELIRNKMQDFRGKKVNVVLQDNTVILGIVKRVDASFLELTNMRLRDVKIPIDEIYEMYYDTKE